MSEESAAAWERRLAEAEADLGRREAEALAGDPTPEALLALARERDKLATDRDVLALEFDAAAQARDVQALDRDVTASKRDRWVRESPYEPDARFGDRLLAGELRDAAAGDRADASLDRRRAATARAASAANREQAAEDRQEALEQVAAAAAEVAQLRDALETRHLIGQAVGMLRERYSLEEEAAFAVLVRLSKYTNVKLRDVAKTVVDHPGDRIEADPAAWPHLLGTKVENS
ncbi:MAG: ANTAR domain-containing protein [Actinomycetota bacterium]|nr:ANTAR domain-containing protein [Actinomycetota bacterium]